MTVLGVLVKGSGGKRITSILPLTLSLFIVILLPRLVAAGRRKKQGVEERRKRRLLYCIRSLGICCVRMRSLAKVFIFVAGIIFIILGVYRGEVSTVFSKAVNICLE